MAKARKTKEKTGFLKVMLTRCPCCHNKEVTAKRFGNVYYDYCPDCGNLFNRTVIP